jgi:hypothetical protein
VHTPEECKKFGAMIRHYQRGAQVDWIVFTRDWNLREVDAVNLFPKLPVHLRQHYTKWLRNQMVKDQVKQAKEILGKVREVHMSTARQVCFELHGGVEQPRPMCTPIDSEPQIKEISSFTVGSKLPGPNEREEHSAIVQDASRVRIRSSMHVMNFECDVAYMAKSKYHTQLLIYKHTKRGNDGDVLCAVLCRGPPAFVRGTISFQHH